MSWRSTENYYVAKFGRDDNSGTQLRPKLSIGGGLSITGESVDILIGAGIYREAGLTDENDIKTLIGNSPYRTIIQAPIGGSIFDLSATNTYCSYSFKNLKIKGFTEHGASVRGLFLEINNCIVESNTKYCEWDSGNSNFSSFSGGKLINSLLINQRFTHKHIEGKYCTFIGCVLEPRENNTPLVSFTRPILNHIFSDSFIIISNSVATGTIVHKIANCLFSNDSYLGYKDHPGETISSPSSLDDAQRYIVILGSVTIAGMTYDSYESFVYTTGDTISGTGTVLKVYDFNTFKSYFQGLSIDFGLEGCVQGDPLFNDAAKGDYSLQDTSPARSLDDDGQAVGFSAVGSSIYAASDTTGWTLTNMQWDATEAGFILIDETLDGQIETPVVDQGSIKAFTKIDILGSASMRDGEHFDTDSQLDTALISGGSPTLPQALVADDSYYVNGYTSITVTKADTSTVNYLAGESFTADSGDDITAVSSNSASDEVNKILDRPNTLLIEMKYSDDNVTYTSYKKYLVGEKPQEDGSGRSNGDPNFDSNTANDIVSRYKQFRISVKVGNVKS